MHGVYFTMFCHFFKSRNREAVVLRMGAVFVDTGLNRWSTYLFSAGGAGCSGEGWRWLMHQKKCIMMCPNGCDISRVRAIQICFCSIVVGAWVLWGTRNSWVQGSTRCSVDECVIQVRNYLELFNRRNVLCTPNELDSGVLDRKVWTFLCDGAWCKVSDRGGFAAIALKDDLIYVCRVGWMGNCASPREAEMRGVLTGMELADQLKMSEAEIASDSINSVWAFRSGLGSEVQFMSIMQKSFKAIFQNPGLVIRHIFRERNQLADTLAKAAKVCQWEWNRVDAVPMKVPDIRCMALPRL